MPSAIASAIPLALSAADLDTGTMLANAPDTSSSAAVASCACVPPKSLNDSTTPRKPSRVRVAKVSGDMSTLAFAKLAGLDLATGRGRSYAGCLSVQADGREMNLSWEGPA